MNQPVTMRCVTQAASLWLALAAAMILLSAMLAARAGEADVVEARITALGDHHYRIDTTVRHADDGWDHYADRWDVLDAEGNVLGSRLLAHPHDNEQPFTRSLTLTLPPGTTLIRLQAHDSVHGLGGLVFELLVPEATQ